MCVWIWEGGERFFLLFFRRHTLNKENHRRKRKQLSLGLSEMNEAEG
jgi:hypothetical protein